MGPGDGLAAGRIRRLVSAIASCVAAVFAISRVVRAKQRGISVDEYGVIPRCGIRASLIAVLVTRTRMLSSPCGGFCLRPESCF